MILLPSAEAESDPYYLMMCSNLSLILNQANITAMLDNGLTTINSFGIHCVSTHHNEFIWYSSECRKYSEWYCNLVLIDILPNFPYKGKNCALLMKYTLLTFYSGNNDEIEIPNSYIGHYSFMVMPNQC